MIDWSKIGSLRHVMTEAQALGVLQLIGDTFPAIVAVHDCGLARLVINGHEMYVDKLGNAVNTDMAKEQKRLYEASKPKRGRPRKKVSDGS